MADMFTFTNLMGDEYIAQLTGIKVSHELGEWFVILVYTEQGNRHLHHQVHKFDTLQEVQEFLATVGNQ
jgi:hypothetical protein